MPFKLYLLQLDQTIFEDSTIETFTGGSHGTMLMSTVQIL